MGLKSDNDFSSEEAAFRDAVRSLLPCSVRIARLKVDTGAHKDAKGAVYHLIAYYIFNSEKPSTNYYGEIDLDELEKCEDLLKDFGVDYEQIEQLKSFKLGGYGNPQQGYWVSVVAYDIFENPERYANDFLFLLGYVFGERISKKFERKMDYNSKYGLGPDVVLPPSELLKKDRVVSGFVGYGEEGKHEITIEDLQEDVGRIQLIPTAPDEVKKVFNAAKKLYIFGYFEYYFFTISCHYAFLALESALRNKYNQIYGEPKRFVGLREITKKLVEKGLIPKGEAKIYSSGGELRNALSHLTKPMILLPSPRILERVGYQINNLYDTDR